LALKFILVTGQQPGETASAECYEIDIGMNYWGIPSAKTKNEKLNRVPLLN
jgi:hypothetical protein